MTMKKSTILNVFSALCFVVGTALIVAACKYPNDPVKGNTIPETRLSNVPENDTLARYINLNTFPEMTLSWIGDDPDGYIIGYNFRWTDFARGTQIRQRPWTTILNIVRGGWENVIAVRGTPSSIFHIYNFLVTLGPTDTAIVRIIGDSLATGRTFAVPYKTGPVATDSMQGLSRLELQTPTTGTFIFFSPVDSNLHRFEVASIDNDNAVDPTPAVVNFWTLVSPGSVALIDSIPPANSLAIRHATDNFPGLRFVYRSLDPNNTQDLQFSWSVDDTLSWSEWTPNMFAYVTASSFKPVASGSHTFYLRARNRWGVISPIVSRQFSAVVPDFDDPAYQQRILVINGTPHTNTAVSTSALDTNRVRAFYSEVLDSLGKAGKYDFFTIATPRAPADRFPNDVIFGKYSLVIYLLETPLPILGSGIYKLDADKQAYINRYLAAGGNMIMCGIPDVLKAFNNFDIFGYNIMHIVPITQIPLIQNNARDFASAIGRLGYPTVAMDAAKIPAGTNPDSGAALRFISINFPRGFAQSIGTFGSRTNDPQWQGLPVGVRFQSPDPIPPARRTFSFVYSGFPTYYGQKSSVIAWMRKAVADVYQ